MKAQTRFARQQSTAMKLHKIGRTPTQILSMLKDTFPNAVSPRTLEYWIAGFKDKTASKRRPIRQRVKFMSAYRLWCSGERVGAIITKLGSSDKSLTNWVRIFKDAPPDQVFLDMPFQSSELRRFNFDWNRLGTALYLVREYKRWYGQEQDYKLIPSYRQVFWALRLNDGIYTLKHLFATAEVFVNHEIEELLEQPTTLSSEELSKVLDSTYKDKTEKESRGSREWPHYIKQVG